MTHLVCIYDEYINVKIINKNSFHVHHDRLCNLLFIFILFYFFI